MAAAGSENAESTSIPCQLEPPSRDQSMWIARLDADGYVMELCAHRRTFPSSGCTAIEFSERERVVSAEMRTSSPALEPRGPAGVRRSASLAADWNWNASGAAKSSSGSDGPSRSSIVGSCDLQ